jgi:curved DNA-binding protein CbpA
MVRNEPDPYLVLGVSATATQAEIAHAYRNRLRAHHPDTRHTTPSHEGDEHLRHVLDAYALLRDPARRADYDRATVLAATPPAASSRVPTRATRPSTGPVQIPITYPDTRASADRFSAPPLRAGPVRQHR